MKSRSKVDCILAVLTICLVSCAEDKGVRNTIEKLSQLRVGDELRDVERRLAGDIVRRNELFGFTFLKITTPKGSVDTPYVVFENDQKLVHARFGNLLAIGSMPDRFNAALDSAVAEQVNRNNVKMLGGDSVSVFPK